jgi:hypothetical protein
MVEKIADFIKTMISSSEANLMTKNKHLDPSSFKDAMTRLKDNQTEK